MSVRRVWLLAALLVCAWVLPAAFAQRQTQLEEQIGAFNALLEARQAELEQLEAALSATNTELDAQLSERERLSGQVLSLGEEQQKLSARVAALKSLQRETDLRIARLDAQAATLRRQLQELIVSLHKRRSGRVAVALAGAESLFELRVRNDYLSRITMQDVVLLDTFAQTTADLTRAKVQRERQVSALGARAEELTQIEATLAIAQEGLADVIAELGRTREGQLAEREALLSEQTKVENDLMGARQALAIELERLREEAARQAALAQQTPEAPADDENVSEAAARLERLIRGLDRPAPENEGDFALPFPRPEVARPYGQDAATDIWLRAREPGTAVRAVKSGLVYRTSMITANSGYTVALQHGDGLISAYTNLQVPVVAIGDDVMQGQILGYLGGGIVSADILQLRVGHQEGFDIIYEDPAPLLGLGGSQEAP